MYASHCGLKMASCQAETCSYICYKKLTCSTKLALLTAVLNPLYMYVYIYIHTHTSHIVMSYIKINYIYYESLYTKYARIYIFPVLISRYR
jgi:hypothetical protein